MNGLDSFEILVDLRAYFWKQMGLTFIGKCENVLMEVQYSQVPVMAEKERDC